MSTDGRRLYVTSQDDTGFVMVLDTESHTVTGRIDCPGAERLVITPDGRRLYVTNPGRGTVFVIDTGTQTVTRTISIGNMPLNLAVTPNGTRVYVTADPGGAMIMRGLVAVIDTASEKVIRTFPVVGLHSAVAVAPDGERVYVASSLATRAGHVQVIDARTDTFIGERIPVGPAPRNLVVTPDSRRVVVLGDGIHVIDAATTTVTAPAESSISFPEPPRDIVASGDGDHAYISCMDMVFVVDPKSGNSIGPNIRLDGAPGAMAITPDGHRAYAAASLGQQLVLPFDTMTDSMPVGKRPEAALNPDDRRLYVANSGEGTVGVIETSIFRVEVGGDPWSVCVTPDGLQAYAANVESGDVSLIDIPARVKRGTIEVGSADVLAVSPDGRHVYVAGKGVLSAIDTTTQDFTANEVEQLERPSAVGVSPDSTRVYVADFSAETITAFDARTLDVIGRPIPVGFGCPTRLAVAQDGTVYHPDPGECRVGLHRSKS